MPTAGIVEVIAGERRTPIRQHANEPSFRQMRLNMAFREIRKAESLECSLQKKRCAVDYSLPLDADVKFTAILLELPCVKTAAMGRQAKVEAIVIGKILGRLGSLASGEVGRRTDDGHPKIRTDPDSDHVFSDKFARANACIDLLRHDVGETVVDDDLDVNIRILR